MSQRITSRKEGKQRETERESAAFHFTSGPHALQTGGLWKKRVGDDHSSESTSDSSSSSVLATVKQRLYFLVHSSKDNDFPEKNVK